MLNLPNSLTIARIALAPVLAWVMLDDGSIEELLGARKEWVAVVVFAIATSTDWLDGYVARRCNQVTPVGQSLDPLADKVLISAAFVSLMHLGVVPAWMVAVIISREIIITGLRGLVHANGSSMPASMLGKIKMSSQVVAISLLLLGSGPAPSLLVVGQLAMWVVLLTAFGSAADYVRAHLRHASIPDTVLGVNTGRPQPPFRRDSRVASPSPSRPTL